MSTSWAITNTVTSTDTATSLEAPVDDTGDLDGAATAVIAVRIRGEVDARALSELRGMLVELPDAMPLVIDVSHARCHSGELLTMVCQVRAHRLLLGHDCRLRGLHPEAVDLDHATLEEVFAVYHDQHRDRTVSNAATEQSATIPTYRDSTST